MCPLNIEFKQGFRRCHPQTRLFFGLIPSRDYSPLASQRLEKLQQRLRRNPAKTEIGAGSQRPSTALHFPRVIILGPILTTDSCGAVYDMAKFLAVTKNTDTAMSHTDDVPDLHRDTARLAPAL